jgi:hypothetical protein
VRRSAPFPPKLLPSAASWRLHERALKVNYIKHHVCIASIPCRELLRLSCNMWIWELRRVMSFSRFSMVSALRPCISKSFLDFVLDYLHYLQPRSISISYERTYTYMHETPIDTQFPATSTIGHESLAAPPHRPSSVFFVLSALPLLPAI